MRKTKLVITAGILVKIVALVIFILLMILINKRHSYQLENKSLIEDALETSLSYSAEDRSSDLEHLNSLLQRKFLTPGEKGIIYERISYIYYMEGNTLKYCENVGNALYYLEKAKDVNRQLMIYCDLARYYIDHDAYTQAEDVIKYATSLIGSGRKIDDYRTYSFFFRLQGMLDAHNGNLEQAYDDFDRSRSKAFYWENQAYVDDYVAMADMAEAICRVKSGDVDTARQIIDKYHPMEIKENFYERILVRDFQLPYYETLAYLARVDKDENAEKQYYNEYVSLCEKYDMYQQQLDMWSFHNGYRLNADSDVMGLFEESRSAYEDITTNQNKELVRIISISIDESYWEMASFDKLEVKRYTLYVVVSAIIIIIIICLFVTQVVYFRSKMDNLTGVYNRASLDKQIAASIDKGDMLSAIMIDIDDFKLINDTYGHERGDYVLKKLGLILQSNNSRYTRAYRYGGEEFLVLTSVESPDKVLELAERIRKQIETNNWQNDLYVTVSVGVARNCVPTEMVKKADANLYYTKSHGKNNVCYTINEKSILLNA